MNNSNSQNSEQFSDWIRQELERLREADLFREIPSVDRGADLRLLANGQPLLNLASNNYLGLAGSESLIRGARQALEAYGASSGASRLVTGTFAPHDELDQRAAEFKGTGDALTLGSGYAANVAILSSLADRHAVVFSDRLNHASIIDGIRLSGAKHVRYRHNDVDHLRECMEKHADAKRKILVTDTVFSMDGDIARLAQMAALCKEHGVFFVVDEAHATGVFGQGRGMARELGLAGDIDLHMGTFSKGLGSYGAYVAGSRDVIDLLRNKGRPFIYSTALPPSVIGANLAALDEAEKPERARRLLAISADMRVFLHESGFDIQDSATQIIPVVLGSNQAALKAREFLKGRGLYVAAIRPPTVPEGTARLRLSMRADLADADLELIRESFAILRQELGL